jgi:D-alanyl-D-alanine carboxypeptidase
VRRVVADAGGILSDSEDVARFTRSLFTGGIVSDQSVSQMETFVDAPSEEYPQQVGYGLGVRNMNIDGEDLVGYTGSMMGYSGLGPSQLSLPGWIPKPEPYSKSAHKG